MLKIPEDKKKAMFWEVEDFTRPFDKYKNANPFELGGDRVTSAKRWMWYHPSFLKLIKLSTPIIGMSIFSLLSIYFYFKENIALMIFNLIIFLIFIFILNNTIETIKNNPKTTMYDLYIREYPK